MQRRYEAQPSSTTFTLPTVQTSHTPIHQHHGFGAAFGAEYGFLGKRLAFRFAMLSFKLAAFFLQKLFLMITHHFRLDHADVFQVRFDGVADFGDQ